MSADDRAANATELLYTLTLQEAFMPLFASDYDKSKYLRAEDLKQEKKFRIKPVTEEVFE